MNYQLLNKQMMKHQPVLNDKTHDKYEKYIKWIAFKWMRIDLLGIFAVIVCMVNNDAVNISLFNCLTNNVCKRIELHEI